MTICLYVIERAVARGHGIRVGLEDTTVLADGRAGCRVR
jgi:hypothetical protein